MLVRWKRAKLFVEIGATLVALMVLAACASMPMIGKVARERKSVTHCQINLIKIEGAIDQWAVENDKKEGDTCTWEDLVGPILYLKEIPRCRAGGNYDSIHTVGKTPTCDYQPPAWFDTEGQKYMHVLPMQWPAR